MTSSTTPAGCLWLAALLVSAFLPLPGAWSLVVVTPLVVWLLGVELLLVGTVTDGQAGVPQPIVLRVQSAPRAPPASR